MLGSIVAVLGLISWTYLAAQLSYLPALAIREVYIYGARPDLVPVLQAAALGELRGTRLGLFSGANALIYPRREISKIVTSASPRIASVSVRHDGLHAISISVTEKGPAAVVCGDLPNFDDEGEVAVDDHCYLSDERGYIFEKAPTTTDASVVRYYTTEIPSDPIGTFATSTKEFAAIRSFVKGAEATGMVAKAILTKEAYEYELYIENPAEEALVTVVYFNTAADLDKELSNMSAFWNNMIVAPKTKGGKPSFEYIDVRYGSNVFYRTVNQE